MIVQITTRGNGYTLKSLADGTFGVPTPKFRLTHYERLFGSWRVPRATYIFADSSASPRGNCVLPPISTAR